MQVSGVMRRCCDPRDFVQIELESGLKVFCYPSLDRRKLEFSDFCRTGGLDAPAGVMRQTMASVVGSRHK